MGKAVFGSMGASELELYRTQFLKVIKDAGLEVCPFKKCKGLMALAEHLKTVKRKWVKVNRYRQNMETWYHLDYDHSKPKLEELAIEFGGLQNYVVFVVQDEIETDIEIGFDGWTVDGRYPSRSFQGYEKKNELYIGSEMAYDELPEHVRYVNEQMAPIHEEYGYRNFMATEIRVKDDVPYYIDPTERLAGQTMEHQLESCTNLADVIYRGASGELVDPEFSHKYAAEATMHYTAGKGWKVLRIHEEAEPWCKLYHYCVADELYHFPPHESDEVGVIVGLGDSIKEAVENLYENFEHLKDEPLEIRPAGFVDLLKSIETAEEEGIEFSPDPIPEPTTVLNA